MAFVNTGVFVDVGGDTEPFLDALQPFLDVLQEYRTEFAVWSDSDFNLSEVLEIEEFFGVTFPGE